MKPMSTVTREDPRGSGAADKTLVAIAFETNGSTLGRAYLKTIDSFRSVELEQFVKDHVTTRAKVSMGCCK